MNNNWKEEFDAKYGYEYPRCALIMKNVEVRDENEDLIGHTDTAAVTPDEIKSFIESLLSSQRKEWVEDLEQWARSRMTNYEGSELKEKLALMKVKEE